MSTRYEMVGAADCAVALLPPGTEVGEDTLTGYGLSLGSDNPLVIEGSREDLVELWGRIGRTLPPVGL